LVLRILGAVLAVLVAGAAAASSGAHAAELTAEQLAGQRIVFAFQGPTPPPGLLTRIRRGEAGAVILFGGNVSGERQAEALIARLQGVVRPRGLREPLLIMVDQEGGAVRRLPGGPEPSAATIGARGSVARAEAAGRVAGRVLSAVGANVNLAPVADVPRPGTVIEREQRAFGRDPERVARMAAAYADGLWVTGVAGAAKHFPGLGPAPANTDDRGVTLDVGAEELREIDERPFVELIEREIPLVMLSTAVYPALDAKPAALSRPIATNELRRRLGFEGVSISDALDTPALEPFGSVDQTAVASARAGTDLLIYATGYAAGDRAADGLAQAIRTSRVTRRSSVASLSRILALRQGFRDGVGLDRVPSAADAWTTSRAAAALASLGW
jgi:beta-N-acetylhexosaminidase